MNSLLPFTSGWLLFLLLLLLPWPEQPIWCRMGVGRTGVTALFPIDKEHCLCFSHNARYQLKVSHTCALPSRAFGGFYERSDANLSKRFVCVSRDNPVIPPPWHLQQCLVSIQSKICSHFPFNFFFGPRAPLKRVIWSLIFGDLPWLISIVTPCGQKPYFV